MKKFYLLMLASIALFAKPLVTVSILPQKYFVEQIAGDLVDVNVMVGAGYSPENYEPKPQQMKDLEQSSAYFAIGMPYENTWLKKFTKSYKKLLIVHTDDGIKKRKLEAHHHHHEGEHDDHDDHDHDAHHDHDDHDHDAHHDHDDHDHDAHHDHDDHDHHAHDDHDHDAHHDHDDHDDHDEHDHHAGMPDPHIWLDPMNVKIQAKTITNALIKIQPKNKEIFTKNLNKFDKKLDKLDLEIKNILKDVKSREFMVYHPSWGYFADRYNLKQIAIEIEGKEPKLSSLKHLVEEAKEHNIKVIFVQPQFSQKSAKAISAQINAKVVPIDQLAYDWEKELLKSTKALASSLK